MAVRPESRSTSLSKVRLLALTGAIPGHPFLRRPCMLTSTILRCAGTVFDVSNKAQMYGPGASYNIFAGKDGSRGLGMSSLKPEDAVPDWSTLDPASKATLDQWHGFFTQRYNIVGKVSDLPEAVQGRS